MSDVTICDLTEDPVFIDFETGPIMLRPNYPPRPVGVSIRWPGQKARYYGWGHPTNNNCTEDQARKALELVWKSGLRVGGHNLPFDLDVAEVHLGLPMLPWQKMEETMFILFLNNPHSKNLGLKESANDLLKMKPEERDAVKEWLLANQDDLHAQGLLPMDVKLSTDKNKEPSDSGWPQYYAAWISLAPGDLVGRYCNGDVDRTCGLWKLLRPSIHRRRMDRPYDVERRLIPILLEIERQGVRVDLERLRDDVARYSAQVSQIESWAYQRLGAEPFNLASGPKLVAALIKAGKVDLVKLGTTPKSKPEKPTYKTSAEALEGAVDDPVLAAMLKYHGQLHTCLETFMRTWLGMAEQSDGLIFTHWNQIRSEKFGARTGRFSSTPSFMNIPQEFKPIWRHEGIAVAEAEKDAEKKVKLLAKAMKMPVMPFELLPLPKVRGYIIPYYPDHVLIDRDYSQQEPRIFGHFEDGPLKEAYNANPWLDLHDHASEELFKLLHVKWDRKPVKAINLGLLYGMGLDLLATKADVTRDEARTLSNAIKTVFPGLKNLNEDMRIRSSNEPEWVEKRFKKYKTTDELPIWTWGGREYFCEPPIMRDNRLMTFDYKMINCLVQGSAADCTKAALIALWEAMKEHPTWLLLLTVHDEILMSVPEKDLALAMTVMRDVMASPKFDVPMLSEGTYSRDNWAAMKTYDKKGVIAA